MTTAINMVDAQEMVMACYQADEPLMLIGPPGIGKTAMFEHVCYQALNINFIDFRLSLRDQVDVGGMRVPDPKTGVLRHYVPEDLPDPKRHGERGIVLFDEINVVSQMMQATAYGIVQERRNGSYRMEPGWVPMAAGNRTTDRAAAQRISSALANRFNIQYVEPDLDSWLQQYAIEHVDTRGTAFLRFRPELFHVMPDQSSDEIRFPSARSWTKAFKFIDQPSRFRRKVFAGYVGTYAADEFEAFWTIMENAPSLDQIVDDPNGAKVPDPSDVGTLYAVSGMLARLSTRKNWKPVMTYVNRLPADYQVVTVQGAVRREPGLKNTEAYGNWAVDHQDVTL